VPAKHGRQNHAKQILAVVKVALEQELVEWVWSDQKDQIRKSPMVEQKDLYYCLIILCFRLMPAGIVTATSLLWQLKKMLRIFFSATLRSHRSQRGDLCDYW
jgi:hypothetical protein